MKKSLIRALKRWRQNYYLSHFLASVARPIHALSSGCERQIRRTVQKNGGRIPLPNGQIMRLGRDAGINLASALYWSGLDGIEAETSRVMRFLFERSSVFVDVGANYGFYSLLAALWNPDLRVVAFEPVPAIFAALQKNIQLNGLAGRVICENLALGARSGTAPFYLPPTDGKDLQATGTLSADSWQVRHNSPSLKVDVVNFDEYETSRPMRVDLIKIDVEDFEADVLQGMGGIIKRDEPFIVCEILPRNREHKNERTRQVLQALNYAAYWITPAGCVRVTRFDFERDLTNFLLTPVAVPGEVLVDLTPLWELKRQRMRADVA